MGAETRQEMKYAELTAPLQELTQKGQQFAWTSQHQRHFEMIKERLCSDKVMMAYDPRRKIEIYKQIGEQSERRSQ